MSRRTLHYTCAPAWRSFLRVAAASALVAGLAGAQTKEPGTWVALDRAMPGVVWSFACSNSALNTEDSIAEVAMESATSRAAAYYGASVPSGTTANHELDRQMFKAVYDLGITTHAQAIQYGEHQMAALTSSENAWMYLLPGDPEMQIRRRNPLSFVVVKPKYVPVCLAGPCYLELSVFTEIGNPAPGVLVSLWKKGRIGDEVLANQYKDRAGNVRIQIAPVTTGAIQIMVNDRAGSATKTSIAVM